MKKLRIIPRIDIKNNNLVKGIQLEGLRVMGDPSKYAKGIRESLRELHDVCSKMVKQKRTKK